MLADLQRERSKRKEAETLLKEQETAREQAERQAQEAAGQWKELYEGERKKREDAQKQIVELQRDSARVEALESVIRQSNTQMLEEIPEENRALLPIDHLKPEEVYAYMPQWVKQFSPPPAVDIGTGNGEPGTGDGVEPKLTPYQQQAYAMGNWESKQEYLDALDSMAIGT